MCLNAFIFQSIDELGAAGVERIFGAVYFLEMRETQEAVWEGGDLIMHEIKNSELSQVFQSLYIGNLVNSEIDHLDITQILEPSNVFYFIES